MVNFGLKIGEVITFFKGEWLATGILGVIDLFIPFPL